MSQLRYAGSSILWHTYSRSLITGRYMYRIYHIYDPTAILPNGRSTADVTFAPHNW